jgi:hypothetical protein
MKSIVVSFEPLFYHDAASAIGIIKLNIDKKFQQGVDVIIGTILIEIIPPHEISSLEAALEDLKTYSQRIGIENFKLILMPPYRQYSEQLKKFDIYYYDYLARITYNAYESRQERKSNTWNPDSKKLLAITGIPHRYNRIRLLYKLYTNELLTDDTCVWSFFKPFSDESWKECRRFLSDISDKEFLEFMEFSTRTIDGVEIKGGKFAGQTMVDDFSLPKETYSQTCLSIIAETHCYPDQPKYDISEKTWRAIINRHPFLVAGTEGNTKYLRSLGYRLFDKCFPLPYDETDDLETTLNNIVFNTKYFFQHLEELREDITADIEHNYKTFIDMIQSGNYLENYLRENYDVSDKDLSETFHATNYWHLVGGVFLEPLDKKQTEQKESIVL